MAFCLECKRDVRVQLKDLQNRNMQKEGSDDDLSSDHALSDFFLHRC